MDETVYKIARRSEWEAAEQSGAFTGSPDDERDGFIHLSRASQLRVTYERHFAGEDDLLLVALNAGRLGPALKWEVSRGGEEFPHLYAPLHLACVRSVTPIQRQADGTPVFPA